MAGDPMNKEVPDGLRYRFLGVAVAGFVGLSISNSLATTSWGVSIGVWGLIIGYTGFRLEQNRPSEAVPVRQQIGVANGITLFRGWLLAFFVGLVVSTPTSTRVLGSLFVLAVSLDALDGEIARRTTETVLGTRLDTATDALAVLVGAGAAVWLDVVPGWYLLAGVLWYLYAAGLHLRQRAGKPVCELPESRVRPLVGSAQFAVIALALSIGTATLWLSALAGVALIGLAASFSRDWTAATGQQTAAMTSIDTAND